MPARSRPPYVAYLRIYEPVEHLPAPDRARWTTCVRSRLQHRLVEADQYVESVRRLAGRPPVLVPPFESDDARVIEVAGALYVCPQQPRLGVWQQLELAGQDQSLPELAAGSPAVREQAAADLAAYVRGGGEVRLFTRSSSWQIPVAWFVPFAADDRLLELANAVEGAPDVERSLRYRSAMSAARRRCARGLRAARAHLEDTEVVEQVEQVARWLEEFDPRSIVELDYAGLVELLDDAHLRGDDSASDVAEGLAALTEGDAVSAAAAYRRWSTRWQRVAMLARAS